MSRSRPPAQPSERTASGRQALLLTLTCGILALTTGTGCDSSSSDKTETRTSQDPSPDAEPVARPPRPAEGYVGSKACAECHADIATEYQTHAMAHSLTEILEEPIENYKAKSEFQSLPGKVYDIEAAETGVTHSEQLQDQQGNTIYERKVPVHYAMGSGHKGRSYLINHNGLLFMSPVSWYSEQQRFDLSPGYEPGTHAGFGRQITDGCLSCHTGLVDATPDRSNRYASSPFLEKSIGCERCHGPGRDHVAFQTSAKSESPAGGGKKDPIINPAHLSHRLQEDICSQCHLQGIERILRYGRTEFDFRPGDRLSDIWATFVRAGQPGGLTSQELQFVSQVEQMHSSRCFQQSNGALTCTSCHDPHRSPTPAQREAFYRERCLNCHEQTATACAAPLDKRQTENDSCINCHMPRLPASNVPHTSQTDHRVVRTSSAGRRTGSPSLPGPPQLFDGTESELPPLALQRVRGLMMARSAEDYNHRGIAQQAMATLKSLPAVFPEDEQLLDALGGINFVLGDYAVARQSWLQANVLAPKRESALVGLTMVAREQQQLPEALEYVNRLIELSPSKDDYYHQKAEILVGLGQHVEAIETAEKGLELNPGSVLLYRALMEACDQAGQRQKARETRQKLDQILRALPPQFQQVP